MQDIISPLDNLLSAFKENPWPKPLIGHESYPTDLWEPYLTAVRSTSQLSIFDNTLQVCGSTAFRRDREKVAIWLFDRAKTVGSQQAVADLVDYVSADTFSAFQIMLLSGLILEEGHDLGNNVRLIPAKEIPNTYLRDACVSTIFSRLPDTKVLAALLLPFEHPRWHYKQDERTDAMNEFTADRSREERLEDARLCLSLIGPWGIQSFGTSLIVPDAVPVMRIGWSCASTVHSQIPHQIITMEAEQAKALHTKFVGLPEGRQRKLRIPLSRISMSATVVQPLQKAIELRTAMESLFLGGIKDELKFRLALRAAFYLGGPFADRKKNFDTFKDAYDLGSSAIHNGQFSKKEERKGPGARAILKEVTKLLCNSCKKMINNPPVDWKDIELCTGWSGANSEESSSA